MQVFIKNKFLSLTGASVVLDADKKPVYKVKGKMKCFSPTKKKKIYDMEGNLKYIVRNKYWNFFSRRAFIFDANKQKVGTLRDKYVNVNGEYFLEDNPDEIKIQGKAFKMDSKILRNGEVIGTVSRNIVALDDAFMLEAEEADIPFLIAIIIAMDNIFDERTRT